MLCPADLSLSTHFLCFVQSSECEWIAVLRVTRGTHQFSLDFLSKWLEISLRETSRGFESHPLRQNAIRFCEWLFSCYFAGKAAFPRTKSSEIRPTIFVFFLISLPFIPLFFLEFSPSSTLSLLPAENFFPWHAPK